MRYEGRWANGRKGFTLGFTLIEFLVVVAIIAILAGLLLPVLSKARQAARDAAERDRNGAVPVVPIQAEKSPVFPSGQEIVTVGKDDLEGYLAKNKKRVISVTPLYKSDFGNRPSHYLIVMESK